jgi:hypothetical protein
MCYQKKLNKINEVTNTNDHLEIKLLLGKILHKIDDLEELLLLGIELEEEHHHLYDDEEDEEQSTTCRC